MNLSIAIPDSSLSDESTKMDKTRKASQLARSAAIFQVKTIFIYQDGDNKGDRNILGTIFRYLDTPQFLRKRLFPKMNELKFAGVLHPLKIPSHVTPSNAKKIKNGDIREGIIVSVKGKKFVDVGINQLIPFFGKENPGKRITVQFKSDYPNFTVKQISKEESPVYWGYKIKERSNLFGVLSEWNGPIIITSRKGKIATKEQLAKHLKTDAEVLVVFGAPDKGVHEILGNKLNRVQNSKVLNFFPDQATETIRLEEALLGTLSIMNIHRGK